MERRGSKVSFIKLMHYLETWKGSWGLGTSRKLVMASKIEDRIQRKPLLKSKTIPDFCQI